MVLGERTLDYQRQYFAGYKNREFASIYFKLFKTHN